MKKCRTAVLTLVVAVAAAATACGGGASTHPSGRTAVPGGSISYRLNGDWRNFDVQTVGDGLTQNVLVNAYSTLLFLDLSGKIQGYMAKSWNISPDSVSFVLKPGMTCSDGTPVTATVVKNSFQRMIDIKAQYNNILFGPGPYTVSADDATNTFTFKTGAPFSDLVYGFIQTFPGSLSGIVCPAGLKNPELLPTRMFGAGPYTLVDAVHGDHVTLKLRPEFTWGPFGTTAKTVGVPDTVTYKIIPNETTAANALLTGTIDIAAGGSSAITGTDIDRLLATPGLISYEQPTYALHMMAFNEAPGHVGTDETIRHALITAIDPALWLKAAQGGHGRLSPSFITKDTNCFDPNTAKLAPKPSVEAARKVLTDAGWVYANGKLTRDGQPLKFTFTGGLLFNAGPEYVVNQWTQMGADVTLSNPDYTTFALGITNGKYEVSVITTSTPGPFMGPVSKRISGNSPPLGTNYAWTTDPVLNNEAAQAEATLGAESCKHWANFQEEIWKKWHLLPLAAPYGENFSKNIDMSLGVTPIMFRRVK